MIKLRRSLFSLWLQATDFYIQKYYCNNIKRIIIMHIDAMMMLVWNMKSEQLPVWCQTFKSLHFLTVNQPLNKRLLGWKKWMRNCFWLFMKYMIVGFKRRPKKDKPNLNSSKLYKKDLKGSRNKQIACWSKKDNTMIESNGRWKTGYLWIHTSQQIIEKKLCLNFVRNLLRT